MANPAEALLGLTSLLILIFNYGVCKWFAARFFEDDGHRGPLAAAATGTLLATSLVLITGGGLAASIAALVPWLMVSFFTWPSGRLTTVALGAATWAVWWAVQGAARAFTGLSDVLAGA